MLGTHRLGEFLFKLSNHWARREHLPSKYVNGEVDVSIIETLLSIGQHLCTNRLALVALML